MAGTHEDAELVASSWREAARNDKFAGTFYSKLFLMRPDFKTTLFARTDLATQSKMLNEAMELVIQELRDPDSLILTLAGLGVRHCRYGVEAEDYPYFTDALLWTLQHYLGDKFTPRTKEAWVGVLKTITDTMSATCCTEEGMQLLREYEEKHPVPTRRSHGCAHCRTSWSVAALSAAIAAVAIFLRFK